MALAGYSLLAALLIFATAQAETLLNGRNLDGFDTFLRTKGLNNDPEKVGSLEKSVGEVGSGVAIASAATIGGGKVVPAVVHRSGPHETPVQRPIAASGTQRHP